MTNHPNRKREAFLIVLAPDSDFRERHFGTLASANKRAEEWLTEHNHSQTAEENGKQNGAYIYRISDFPSLKYGEIIASKASCGSVILGKPI